MEEKTLEIVEMGAKTKGIADAFVAAQKEFGQVLKTANNPFFKSKYADLASVHDAVIDALHNHDIALLQKTHDCDTGVKIETIFMHVTGEQISGGLLFVPAQQQDPQKYGSALTYARRYSLLSAAGLPAEDDDGNKASSVASKLPPQQPVAVRRVEEVKKS